MAKSFKKCQAEIMFIDPIIFNDDCINRMETFDTGSIDCIITDPPYNLGNFMLQRNTNIIKMRKNAFAYAGWDNLNYDEWKMQMNSFFAESSRVLKKRGTLLLFMSIIKVESIIQLAEQHGFYYKTTGVWHKTNPMPRNMNIQFVNSLECWIYFVNHSTSGTFNNNGRVIHDFLESAVCPLSEKKFGRHPTQKPISIMKKLIEYTTNPGDTILDPFMGSGTTCLAGALLGRNTIGIELNKEYYTIAHNRIEQIKDEL